MTSSKPVQRRLHPSVQQLESRCLLAAFGTPWPNPRSLTVSFPDDGIDVAGASNDLHAELNAVATSDQWQELLLRAFQTWSIHADINVGLQSDANLDLGVMGLAHDDPRMGDFRVAARPQTGVIANALPYQQVAGTFAGDLVLNSDETFRYDDWSGGTAAPTSGDEKDLFSVFLHETGNSLGLPDNLQTHTVMFANYSGLSGVLSQDDISEIQALYGQRSDPYESVSNDTVSSATLIPAPVGFDPSVDVISVRGSIAAASDVDVFEHPIVAGESELQIRLQTNGISLLESDVEVLDQNGLVIASAVSQDVFQNSLTLDLSDLSQTTAIHIRLQSKSDSYYEVGDYVLQLDYRPTGARAALGDWPEFDFDYAALWDDDRLIDGESGVDDTVATAEVWDRVQSALDHDPYVANKAIASAGDVDHLSITAPSVIDGALRVQVSPLGTSPASMRVQVLDDTGQTVGAVGRLHANGTWVLEVAEPVASQEYIIAVSVDPSSTVDVGNYLAEARFLETDVQMVDFVSGTLSGSNADYHSWAAGDEKLYRFELSVSGTAPNATGGVKMIIYDAQTLQPKFELAALAGDTRAGFVMLPQGDYVVRTGKFGGGTIDLDFQTRLSGISDDQDPNDPYDYDYNYEYYYDYSGSNYYYYYDPYGYYYGGY
ncbi:MAG: matrixin family metalloprotease [Planctomycetota bacterium]